MIISWDNVDSHKMPFRLIKNVFEPSDFPLEKFTNLPNWEFRTITVCGKERVQNRQTAFFSSKPGINYRYSNNDNESVEWSPEIKIIRDRVSEITRVDFNFCLANRYEDGNSRIGWHSDDVRGLDSTTIASVSFGAERFFDLRNKTDSKDSHRFVLSPGSLMIMEGDCQEKYKHQVPMQKKVKGVRINLTFRKVKKNY